MAAQAGRSLLNLIECAVCLGIFNDPHQLSCLHTYCHGCLLNLVNSENVIVCPHCRKETSVEQIKKDFKSQEIVDLHNAQQKEQNETQFLKKLLGGGRQQGLVCQVCQKGDEIGRSRCLECDQVMCRQCENVHKSIKSCSQHTVVPNQLITQTLKDKADSDRKQLHQQTHKKVKAMKATLDQNLGKLSAWQNENMAQLEKNRMQHLSEVETHYARLKESVHSLTAEVLKGLQHHGNAIQKYTLDAQALNTNLNHRMETASIEELLEIADGGVEDVKNQIGELTKTLEGLGKNVKLPPVTIVCGGNLDLQNVTSIVSKSRAFDLFVNNNASKMRHNQYKLTDQLKLDSLPQRLCYINDRILCIGHIGSNSTISAYDHNCNFCAKIEEPNLRFLLCLTEVHSGCLVAACDKGEGLHLLDPQAAYIGSITTGSFCDVTSWSYYLYALEYEQCKVQEFEENGSNKWTQKSEIKLTYSNRHRNSWDTLAVNKDGIFVCALKTCSIYQHDHNGQLLQQFGEKGSGDLGKLRFPRLGFVDCDSSVLVMDTQNNRLQVYSVPEGRWASVEVVGELVMPLDATVSPSANTVWLIGDRNGEAYLTKAVRV